MNIIDFSTPFRKQKRVLKFIRFLLNVFYGFKVMGLENLEKLPKNKGVIFAPIHSVFLDVFFTPAALYQNLNLLPFFHVIRERREYKQTLLKWILGGKFIKGWGAYSLLSPFHNTLLSYFESLKIHIEILEAGKSLIIFPEGAVRNGKWAVKNKKILKAQPGVAILAFITGCPVVPVLIKLKNTKSTGLKKFIPFFGKASVKFGEPLFFDQLFNGESNGENFEDFLNASKFIVKKIDELGGL
ncbi:MAG: hypothetical protein Athens071416_20 [Parcubacteria group bacterium Athens0714_16]|nr:MAG: hypothetical protein Athens071416_20 [Parcubacteria group bacterium Athens0714_16]